MHSERAERNKYLDYIDHIFVCLFFYDLNESCIFVCLSRAFHTITK